MKKILLILVISLLSVFSFAGGIVEAEKYDNGNTRYELIANPGIDGDTYEYNAYYADGSIEVKGEYNEYGRKSGAWTTYYQSGQMESYAFYNNGTKHSRWWWYDTDGSVVVKIEYKYGKKHGEWNQYTRDGKLVHHREFKKGKKHGEWETYSGDDGMLLATETYKRDKLVQGWEWSENKGLIARYP